MAKTFLFHLLACVFASGVILLVFRLFIVPLGYLSLPYLYQISTDLLYSFLKNVHIIIQDNTAFLEHFISAGKLSYIDRICVEYQNISSYANTLSTRSISFFTWLQNYSLHFCISRKFHLARGTSPFSHRRYLYLKKWI